MEKKTNTKIAVRRLTVIEPNGKIFHISVFGGSEEYDQILRHLLQAYDVHSYSGWSMAVEANPASRRYNHVASMIAGLSILGRTVLVESVLLDLAEDNDVLFDEPQRY